MQRIVVESIPSVGLAVVDSMLAQRIKAFGSHAQAFHPDRPPFRPRASMARRQTVPSDRRPAPVSRGI
jgi:hypothetical protein